MFHCLCFVHKLLVLGFYLKKRHSSSPNYFCHILIGLKDLIILLSSQMENSYIGCASFNINLMIKAKPKHD